MTDGAKVVPARDEHAAGDTSKKPSTRTQAGQEAAKGHLPAEHDREHQSNYGGGGPNGGASEDAKR